LLLILTSAQAAEHVLWHVPFTFLKLLAQEILPFEY